MENIQPRLSFCKTSYNLISTPEFPKFTFYSICLLSVFGLYIYIYIYNLSCLQLKVQLRALLRKQTTKYTWQFSGSKLSQESHSLAFFIMLSRLLFVHVVLALTLISRTKRNLQNLSHVLCWFLWKPVKFTPDFRFKFVIWNYSSRRLSEV